MKRLITGATGFIGGYLQQHLLRQYPQDDLFSSVCDLTDPRNVTPLIHDFQPDQIYHLAGLAQISKQAGLPQYFAKNFLTTLRVVEAASQLNKTVEIFFASSMHVYGNQEGSIDESKPATPNSPYGFTKLLAEEALRHYSQNHAGLRIAVARLCNCVGPKQPLGFVASDLCYKLAHLRPGQPLEVGSLSGYRAFLDVRDAVQFFPQLLGSLSAEKRYEIFNVGSPHQLQISEALKILLQIAKINPTVQTPADSPSSRFTGLSVSVEKLKLAVKTPVFRPIQETLRDMYHDALNAKS